MPILVVIGVIAAEVALLSGSMLAVKGKDVPIPVVDTKREAAVGKQRKLRIQGNTLLQQGRTAEAHDVFQELYKVAPKSPYVIDRVQKLSAIRTQEEMSRQQIAQAAAQRDQGVALFNEKKFTEAIAVLQQSFSTNPGDEQTAQYLKLAQQEEQKALQAKQIKPKPSPGKPVVVPTTTVATNTKEPERPVNNSPASLTTIFNGNFKDGYITVKVGSELVVNEPLWEEKGRGLFKRKGARVVNTTRSFTPRNTDVIVSVVVPSQNINDSRVITHNFQPGSSQRLVVSFNPASKTFDYQLN